jgi:hypothetical protein
MMSSLSYADHSQKPTRKRGIVNGINRPAEDGRAENLGKICILSYLFSPSVFLYALIGGKGINCGDYFRRKEIRFFYGQLFTECRNDSY